MTRRLFAAVLFAAAALGVVHAPHGAAAAAAPTYLLIGASVPRAAEPALRARFGASLRLEAVWGRSFIHPDMLGGPTIWQVFWDTYRSLRPGDWLIIDHGHGAVSVATNRWYLQQVVRLLPDGVCLAVVRPHTYYGPETAVAQEWNREMDLMQREVIVGQPCHAQVWWGTLVQRATAAAVGLSAEERALGEPWLYDGRHPTPAGSQGYAAAVAWAVGLR